MAVTSTVAERSAGLAARRGVALAGWLGGVVLGLILLVAAAAKALDPAAFAEQIAGLGFAGPLPPLAVALTALAIETLLGALLLANLRTTPVLAAATLLVLFFVGLTGRAAWRAARGEEESAACGCFGNLLDRTPNEAFVQDLLMLAPALLVAWAGRPGAADRIGLRVGVALALTSALTGFAAAAPGLPIDDWATRLRPGAEIAAFCAGRDAERVCLPDLAPELAEGSHLVVIADAGAADFPALAARLNAHTRAGGEPPVQVLAELSPEREQELFWTVAPAFELQTVPRGLIRPLYRSLPRSFRVEAGRVAATWPGLPPGLAAAEPPR